MKLLRYKKEWTIVKTKFIALTVVGGLEVPILEADEKFLYSG